MCFFSSLYRLDRFQSFLGFISPSNTSTPDHHVVVDCDPDDPVVGHLRSPPPPVLPRPGCNQLFLFNLLQLPADVFPAFRFRAEVGPPASAQPAQYVIPPRVGLRGPGHAGLLCSGRLDYTREPLLTSRTRHGVVEARKHRHQYWRAQRHSPPGNTTPPFGTCGHRLT